MTSTYSMHSNQSTFQTSVGQSSTNFKNDDLRGEDKAILSKNELRGGTSNHKLKRLMGDKKDVEQFDQITTYYNTQQTAKGGPLLKSEIPKISTL